MKLNVFHDQKNGVLHAEFFGAPFDEGRCSIQDHLVTLASLSAERLLVDYTGLARDLGMEDVFAFLEADAPIPDSLKAIKMAAVLNAEQRNVSIQLSILFGMGLRVAVFTDPARALRWLTRDEPRPTWLRERD